MKYFDLDLPGINTARFLMGIKGNYQIMIREADFNQYCFDLIYNPAGKREQRIITSIPFGMVLDSYFLDNCEDNFDIDLRELMKEVINDVSCKWQHVQ